MTIYAHSDSHIPLAFVPGGDAPLESFMRVGDLDQAEALIWQRPVPERFDLWVNALSPEALPTARVILAPADVRAFMAIAFEEAGTPETAEREWLADEIACLADALARATGAPNLRLRLEAVRGNACRKFHVDALTARLICTYRGPGTQYGVVDGADEPEQIFEVPAGAPIVLRGLLDPRMTGSRLRHRSPPIEGSGIVRFVMVLDPLWDLDDPHADFFTTTD